MNDIAVDVDMYRVQDVEIVEKIQNYDSYVDEVKSEIKIKDKNGNEIIFSNIYAEDIDKSKEVQVDFNNESLSPIKDDSVKIDRNSNEYKSELINKNDSLKVTNIYTENKTSSSLELSETNGDKSRTNIGWYNSDGTINYPPNKGAIKGSEKIITINPGEKFIRYGIITEESTFVTKVGIKAETIALPPTVDPKICREFSVVRSIPNVKQSIAMPWGNSPGGGVQYNLEKPILWYYRNGYIK